MSEAPAATPAPRSRGLIIALIIIGVLLLIGITALVTVLLVGGRSSTDAAASGPTATATPTASASPTPSATPTPTPSATKAAPAPDTSVKFTDFTYPSALTCANAAPGVPAFVPEITFSWASSNAAQAWFVMGTSDAADSQFQQIPLKGNQNDLKSDGIDVKMQCHDPQTQFTITLVDSSGKHLSKTATIKNNGDIAP
jgi:uncharacterized iron-regulated membrane protein